MSSELEIKQMVAKVSQLQVEDLDDERKLSDVILDSFDMIEVVIDLQEQLGIRLSQDDLRQLSTVGDLVRFFARAA